LKRNDQRDLVLAQLSVIGHAQAYPRQLLHTRVAKPST
jgi:hypothetical protein